jgi:alpha-ketoglutarate-dependent taurine dioxygenase
MQTSKRIPRGARRRAVDLSALTLVEISHFDIERAPTLVQPTTPEVDLASWAADNRETIEAELLGSGALLFRGFDLPTVDAFERAAGAIDPSLYGGYGDLPREGASDKIYESTPYPPDQAILFHNESSHLSKWPMRIMFYCSVPAQEGGETPLADCREICRRLDDEVLARFRDKGLVYIRNFSDGLDVSWQQFFQTEDRAVVEAACREGGMELEWTDGDGLRVRQPAVAVTNHPETNEELFFNQIQLHHPFYLQDEVRESLQSLFAPDELPRNVLYGDGAPIEDEVAKHVLEVYWDTSVALPWEQGDIIMLDNMLTAHARNPYVGPRKIAVAMAQVPE